MPSSYSLQRTVTRDQDMPDEIKIRCMQTYMRTAWSRKGGKVRGYKGTGKDHPDTVRKTGKDRRATPKKGTDRKSGSGGHNKSTDSFLCKSCGTTKPKDCYAKTQYDNRNRGNGPTCKKCNPMLK